MGLTIGTCGNEFDWVSVYSHASLVTAPLSSFMVYVSDVPDLVSKVKNCTTIGGGQKIDRLIIIGHGESANQRVGSGKIFTGPESEYISLDLLELKTLNKSAETHLPLLRGLFSSNGRVDFLGCQVGLGHHGKLFLKRVSTILGVPASAGVVDQVLFPGFEGEVVTADGEHVTEFEPSYFQ